LQLNYINQMERRFFLLPVMLSLLIYSQQVNGQGPDKVLTGKYTQNAEKNEAFKGVLIFKSDSTFQYKTISKLKDKSHGTYSTINDTVILRFFDSYRDSLYKSFEKEGKPFPMELLGEKLFYYSRPFRLIWISDKLFFVFENIVDRSRFFYKD
jgi:hypothetical protein